MMKRPMLLAAVAASLSYVQASQVGGGSVYGLAQSGSAAAQANERAKHTVTKDEIPPSSSSIFLDASVLMNVKADEYVALFGVSQDGATLEEATQKMDGTVSQLTAAFRRLGAKASDLDVDFVAQNRIYGFEVAGDIAQEKLTGFQVKKNVAVHYRDRAFLDKAIAAASSLQVFDLVKVDYVVKDVGAVQARLMEEAARVLKRKSANHARLLGIAPHKTTQVYAERYSSYYPSELYDSYAAYEAEDVSNSYLRQRLAVQSARKARTFYFNPLNAKLFDHVVNPVVVEPVVQFTLYLKVRSEPAGGTLKKTKPKHTA